MFSTLYRKLLLVFLGFGAMLTILCLAVLRVSHETYHAELAQQLNQSLASRLITEPLLQEAEHLGQGALQAALERLTVVNPDIDIYRLNQVGTVLASSGRSASRQNRVDLEPVRRFLAGADRFPVFGDDPSAPSRKAVFSVAPISSEKSQRGYLYVVLHQQTHARDADRLQWRYSLQEGTWFVLGGAAFAILASLAIIKALTLRLGRLANAMDMFRKGGFAEAPTSRLSADREPDDEITSLTIIFDQMAARIVAQMKELEKTDRIRRELLANVSHDLRTPLTSLRIHLESLLLADENFSAEEKREYLEIATRQAKRISKLVDELFELAKLDANLVKLSPEPFILSELVQDVVQKFELAASGKEVRLRTEIPAQLPLTLADIALVERVLENLTENALRHTSAGGEIVLRLLASPSDITVQVADTGSGISNEDLSHIFDRFCQGNRSRPTASSSSAGLGLAIVKAILELHERVIRVSSQPGKGTTFSFDLPNARAG